ncbi:MAG: hypothetical protein HGGPFJEG_03172 [Ignavibacteria bacterium]|nr:hypothetical protein [Ignavibacteria bacterium]
MKILKISSALILLIILTLTVLFNGSTAKVKNHSASSGQSDHNSFISYMDFKYTSPELERKSVFIQIIEKINLAFSNPKLIIKEAGINIYAGN